MNTALKAKKQQGNQEWSIRLQHTAIYNSTWTSWKGNFSIYSTFQFLEKLSRVWVLGSSPMVNSTIRHCTVKPCKTSQPYSIFEPGSAWTDRKGFNIVWHQVPHDEFCAWLFLGVTGVKQTFRCAHLYCLQYKSIQQKAMKRLHITWSEDKLCARIVDLNVLWKQYTSHCIERLLFQVPHNSLTLCAICNLNSREEFT